MTKSANKSTLRDAFLAAQAEFRAAKLDATNKHFKSKYATLKSVQEAVYPALHKHGISVVFGVVWNPETSAPHGVECKLILGEESMGTMVPCNFSGNPHAQMSAMTYAKRASLSMITGVVLDDESDDDGNEAVKGASGNAEVTPPTPPKKPSVRQIMSDIGKARVPERLDEIEAWVLANCKTSAEHLLECIDKRRGELTDEA